MIVGYGASSQPSHEEHAVRTMVDVTISIVHASKPQLTLDCLESLWQDRPRRCSTEVIVLDNASGDNLETSVAERFSGVQVINQSFRAGFGANHNTVIEATASRYVLVLNPDTRVGPGAIDALVDYLDEHQEAAIAGPAILGFDGVRQGSAWRRMTIPAQLAWALTLGQLGVVVRTNAAGPVHAVSGCAMLARREPFRNVGLFDETYFMYSEEWDLAQRLHRLGLECHYVPTVEMFHHGQESTKHLPEQQVNEIWRSLDVYLGRYHPPLEASILRKILGFGYAFAFAVAVVLRAMPERLRPRKATTLVPTVYRLHVRNAFRGVRKPGLKELADEWNHTPVSIRR